MDSLTQLTLGAAVGEAVAGRQFGRRAMLWGAVCGTFPDLDVFIPLGAPVGWSTVFIIDPLYTLPLLVGVLAILAWRSNPAKARRLNRAGLMLSTLYLAWTVGAKLEVERTARHALVDMGLDAAPLLTTPAPFNSLLWRIVVMTDEGYLEGFRSMLDGDAPVRFTAYPSDRALIHGLETDATVRRLQWFSKGFYRVTEDDGGVVISDLRMGLEPHYVFSFRVADLGIPLPQPVTPVRMPGIRDYSRLRWVWARIGDPEVS